MRLTWTATPGTPDPLFDGAVFHVYRWRVDASGNPSTAVEIPRSPTADTTIVDSTELPDNQTFKYVVKAEFSDGTSSGATVEATVQTVNDAPVANADNYSAIWNKTLTVAAPGVLANDTDTDPPTASLRMALPVVLSPPANGKLTPIKNTDGTASGAFTYTPNKNFVGTDSFTYKANDGIWTDSLGTVAMSPDSTTAAKVTITVIKK